MLLGPKKLVYLTGLEPESLEQLREWRNDEMLRVFFREYREITKTMQRAWYDSQNQKNDQHFEIHERSTGSLIGHCCLTSISWTNRTAEFGIYVGPHDLRGKGYGTDALLTLLRFGFDELALNRIWCEVYSNNSAINVYERIGFRREGLLRQHHFSRGEFVDSHILGMLKLEWDLQKNGA